MTVGELIDELQKFDRRIPVKVLDVIREDVTAVRRTDADSGYEWYIDESIDLVVNDPLAIDPGKSGTTR